MMATQVAASISRSSCFTCWSGRKNPCVASTNTLGRPASRSPPAVTSTTP